MSLLGVLVLATPFASGLLLASLEYGLVQDSLPAMQPTAIILLGADAARIAAAEPDLGPLSLERLRTGAALHRQTGLPLLVTGGSIRPGESSIALLMAQSLAQDFGINVQWVEPYARDTRENAIFSAAMLREAGVPAAFVVTHGWHMRRALEAFGRVDFPGIVAACGPTRCRTGSFHNGCREPITSPKAGSRSASGPVV